MNNNLNINLKFNNFGNPECFSNEADTIDPAMKLKMDALVKRILQEANIPMDQIESISIQNPTEGIHYSIVSLEKGETRSLKNSSEIIALAKDAFKHEEATHKQNVVFNIPREPPKKAPILPTILNTPNSLSHNIFAQIHADEFGKDSELEGSQSVIMVDFLHKFILECSLTSMKYGISSELLTQLHNASSYDLSLNQPATIMKQIEGSLRTKEPMLMTGGWIGNPAGHAIYYELVPGSDDKATLRLYNLGAGIEDIATNTEGIQIKSAPMVEWQGIPYDNLRNITLATVLHELATKINIPYTSKPSSYGGRDIYGALKELLNPESEVVVFSKDGQSLLMTPQRAGMCSWKSLLAFLRTKMDEDNFKIFKCDVKLQSLIDSYNTPDPTSNLSKAAHWRLIQKSLASTSRSIEKLYESGAVGQDYVLKAHELLLPVHQWVKANKSSILRNDALPEVQQLQYQSPGLVDWKEGGDFSPGKPLSSSGGAEKCLQKKGPLIEIIKPYQSKTLEAADIEGTLNNLLPIAKQAWLDKFDQDSHIGLNQLIAMLPIDEAFWAEAASNDLNKAEALILHLGELQALYFKTCWTVSSAEIVFPERILGIHKLAYIMNHLAKIIVPEQWTEFAPYSFLPNSIEFRLFEPFESHLFNPKAEEELKIIQDWCTSEYDRLFTGGALFNGFFQSTLLLKKYNKTSVADIFRHIDPELEIKIQNENASFRSMDKINQDAHIYTSSHLKPWIRAIIDSCLYANCIGKECLYQPAALDRSNDLTLKSEIKPDKWGNLHIASRLSGIDLSDPEKIKDMFQKFYFKSDKARYYLKLINSSPMGSTEQWLNESFLEKPKGEPVDQLKTRAEREEYKELAYLELGDHATLTIPSTLSYFQQHPESIFDIDHQTFFEMFVFKNGLMDAALKLEGFKDKLIHFLEVNVEKSLNDNQIQTSAFLARMSRYLQIYTSDPRLQELQLPLLRKFLESKSLNIDQKSVLYAELCANLSGKEFLDQRDIEELLAGSAFIGRHPVQQSWTNEYVTRDIAFSLQKHASQLQAALVQDGLPNHQFLNRILIGLNPEAKEEIWLMRSKADEYPSFSTTSRSYEYYPWLGNLLSPE